MSSDPSTEDGFKGAALSNRKKDQKLVEKALDRIEPSALHGVIPKSRLQERVARNDVSYEEFKRILQPFQEGWTKKLNAALQAKQKAVRANDDLNTCYEEVDRLTTDLIEDIQDKLINFGLHGMEFFPLEMGPMYFYRMGARFALGKYLESVDDATNCLCILRSYEDSLHIIQALCNRGRALRNMGTDLEGALQDFRACSAAIRIQGDLYSGNDPSLGEATGYILETLALMKADAPRPRFTPSEREKWEKELGLGMYERGVYLCFGCGQVPSDENRLQRCSRCMSVWLCGEKCRVRSWKELGHNRECKEPSQMPGVLRVPEGGPRDWVEASVPEKGYAIVHRRDNSAPAVIVRDKVTGRFFESLSNKDVFFRPSEDHLVHEY